MQLSQLPLHQLAIIDTVTPVSEKDSIAQRLNELGFVAGEEVSILATGPVGKEPLLVRIGTTKFALRISEASRIHVTPLHVTTLVAP